MGKRALDDAYLPFDALNCQHFNSTRELMGNDSRTTTEGTGRDIARVEVL